VKTEIGEYVVGAYLKLVEHCNVVDYNARPPGGGIKGLAEFDVIGLRFSDQTVFFCEVATHLQGLEYGKGYADSAQRVRKKFEAQKAHAHEHLAPFSSRQFMLWSPRVPKGALLEALGEIEGLELVVNGTYMAKVEALKTLARETAADVGNPFFRTLQLLERLKP
jgi:hypothetical protein